MMKAPLHQAGEMMQDALLRLLRLCFTATERLNFYEELAFLLENNIPLQGALQHMLFTATDGGRLSVRRSSATACTDDCIRALKNGVRLDAVLADWLPDQELAFVSTGMANGQLASTLRRAAFVVSNLKEIRVGMLSLIYPVFLLMSTFGMVYATGTLMLPMMEKLTPREQWTGALWLTGQLADIELNYGLLLISALVAVVGFTVWSMANLTGPARRRLDAFMPWSIYRDLQGVTFLINHAALTRAGISPKESLTTLNRFASPWLQERLAPVSAGLSQGLGLGNALQATGLDFPSRECIRKMQLMTGGKNAEQMIENFALRWLETTQGTIRNKFFRLRMYAMLLNTLWLVLSILANQQIGVFQ